MQDLDPSQYDEADRREVDPPVEVETATWSAAGTLDWWVRERREWLGRVRGPDGKQRWIKALIVGQQRRRIASCPSQTGSRSLAPYVVSELMYGAVVSDRSSRPFIFAGPPNDGKDGVGLALTPGPLNRNHALL
jgi:hypothetical protein